MAKFDIVVRVTVEVDSLAELADMEKVVLTHTRARLSFKPDIVDVTLSHICDEDGEVVKEGC